MLKEERQNLILSEIASNNKVYSSTLSKLLKVSEDTIRRDLNELAKSGHIKKVHGGAMANPMIPQGIKDPRLSKQRERVVIAEKVAKLVQQHKVILLDGDTTNLLVVDLLPSDLSATVFTNSLQIAGALFNKPNVETIVLGGRLSHKYRMTLGMDVITALSEIHADLCITETASVHAAIGITEGDRENALTKKAMISAASRVIALCLSDDIGSILPFKVDPLEEIDCLITDLAPDHHLLKGFKNKGLELL